MLLKQYHKYLNALSISICNTELDHLCELYRDVVDKYLHHHGKEYMVKYMKDLNSIAERYSLYQPINPIKFRKSDKNGFPCEISQFRAYLRSDNPKVVKMTLSIFRSVELMRLPPNQDISTVVMLPDYQDCLVQDIVQYIPKFVSKLSSLETKDIFYHYTVKNGPNGPALHSSDVDLAAVMLDDELKQALKVVSTKLKDHMLPTDIPVTKAGIHSKLTQFSEKGGKTRTIAVVDYYSQRALRPLHDALMNILRRLPSDGTYSHNNVGKYVMDATSRKLDVYTSDMTAFTDRFPAVIQHELLKCLVSDQELCEAWWTLLAKRTFTLAWSGETVRYGTGQPMGAYASWALCTLAHHLIVHYTAYKCNIKDVNKLYRIIGDDNVITNKVIACYYKETLQQLGCEINPYKSTSTASGAKYSSAEVAKRLYLNGKDYSPITPGIVRNLCKPYLLNDAIKGLQLSFDDTAVPLRVLEAMYPYDNKDRRKALVLLTNPFDGCIKPNMLGYDTKFDHPWGDWISDDEREQEQFNDELFETIFNIRYQSLMAKVQKVNSDPKGLEGLWVRLQTDPHLDLNQLRGTPECGESHTSYAVLQTAKHIKQKLNEALSNIMLQANNYSYDKLSDGIKLFEVEYIPDPTCPFTDTKDLRSTQASCLIESCYQELSAVS